MFVLAAVVTSCARRPLFWVLIAAQGFCGYVGGVLESVLNVHLAAALPNAATLLNRLHAFFGVGALLPPRPSRCWAWLRPLTAVWWGLPVPSRSPS